MNMNMNKNKNKYSKKQLNVKRFPAKSGLRISIGGCLHDKISHHLDSLIDGSVLNVKIPLLATARSNHFILDLTDSTIL